jgi:rod shape-determining protein MreC
LRGSPRLRLLLVLLVLTAFTLTALDYRSTGGSSAFDAVRRGSDTVFGPAQRAVGGVARSVGSALGGLPRIGRYRSDNAKLRDENDRLQAQLRATDGLRTQAKELAALLKLATVYTTVPARVSAVTSAFGFEWTATLDAGSRDGVREGQTVINGQGLVGRVKRTGAYTSTVLLLADPGFGVGFRLQRSGALGFLDGSGLGAMDYKVIGQVARVDPGDVAVTSGESTFVPGIPIGRVTSIDTDVNALTRTGKLAPFVDVTSLGLVGIVTTPPRGTPRFPLPVPKAVAPSPRPSPGPTRSPSPSPSPR